MVNSPGVSLEMMRIREKRAQDLYTTRQLCRLSVSVKLGVRTEMSGPKSCEALASTCRLRRSLAGCLKFRRSGRSRRVRSRAEKKLKKTRAS